MKVINLDGRRNVSGERVRQVRTRKRLTQADLTGVILEQDAISRIESGSRMVQDYELRALAEVLGVTADWLMEDDEKHNHRPCRWLSFNRNSPLFLAGRVKRVSTTCQLRKDCYLRPINGLTSGITNRSPSSSSLSWLAIYSTIWLSFFPSCLHNSLCISTPGSGICI